MYMMKDTITKNTQKVNSPKAAQEEYQHVYTSITDQ